MHANPVSIVLRQVFALVMLLTVVCLSIPPVQAGIKLYKAKESEVTFASGGQQIKVWVFTPTDGQAPFPGVVALYGIDGLDVLEKDKSIQMLYKTVAGKIADKGFVVHLVHYFNRTPLAQDAAEKLKKQLMADVPKLKTKPLDANVEKLFREWTAATKEGIDFLRESKDVDKTKIGLVGISMGGFVGTSLAVDQPDLKLSAIVNVFGGLPPQQYQACRECKTLPPLLVLGAEDDEVVPIEFQRDLYGLWCSTGTPREAHFYGNVGHAFFDKERGAIDMDLALNEALPVASRFLKRHVQGLKIEKK